MLNAKKTRCQLRDLTGLHYQRIIVFKRSWAVLLSCFGKILSKILILYKNRMYFCITVRLLMF